MGDKREEAIGFMQNSQYDLAIPLFIDLLESDSADYSIHYMIGQCYKFNGQLTEALKSLIKSEELVSEELVNDETLDRMKEGIYLALGIAYQENDEFDKAVATLKKGTENNPQDWKLHNSLGLTYKYLGNFKESLFSYIRAQEMIVKKANHSEIRTLEDGSKTLVADLHQTYLNLKSSSSYCMVLNNIGGTYLAAGDLKSAEKAFNESIEFIPEGFNYPNPKHGLDLVEQKKSI
jgi:tetratricopeptide (TPR) repeat protein